MDDELLDIVDDNDNITGIATRREMHSKGHIHRSVLFFIFDHSNKIFVNQRSFDKEFYPGYWSLVLGGHVLAGETYDKAIARESIEETGINFEQPISIAYLKKRFDPEDRENASVYSMSVRDNYPIQCTEITRGWFTTIDEINYLIKTKKFLPETQMLMDIF